MSQPISALASQRWRFGAVNALPPSHIGTAKPNIKVEVRPGMIDRSYDEFVKLNGDREFFGRVQGSKHQDEPWQGGWRSFGPWVEIPNIANVEREQDFSGEGVQAVTVHIENVIYKELVGVSGAYHIIARGYMAPWQGYVGMGRPGWSIGNEWLNVLNGGYKVRIYEGYGDAMEPVFVGLIDDTDAESSPDTVTLTCRDFGSMLVDQRVYGWNKAREIRSPIIFSDRLRADDVEAITGGAQASSSSPGHPARNVADAGKSFWQSVPQDGYVQIHLAAGHYENFYVRPHYPGQEMYVSIYVRNRKGGKPALVNNVPKADRTWVNLGKGNVPGEGQPFTYRYKSLDAHGYTLWLGCGITVGDNTILRISVRPHRTETSAIERLNGWRRKAKADAKKQNWILVDDATDLVKWALMWAGFKEWYIEPFGARIKEKMVFHQSDFLIDIVKRVRDQANYVFYIDRPSSDPESIGVPVFRRSRAMEPLPPGSIEVRDQDLLTRMNTKFSKENLPFLITVRGKTAKKAQGGSTWGEDTTKRVIANYWPPWSGAHRDPVSGLPVNPDGVLTTNRLAGLWKMVLHNDRLMQDSQDCMMMAILIAVQEALAAATATAEFPGHPGLTLDDQVSVLDGGTGINSRIWVAQYRTSFTSGEQPEYRTNIGGALLDTPELNQLAIDYLVLIAQTLAKDTAG